jgi:hypothetical protein
MNKEYTGEQLIEEICNTLESRGELCTDGNIVRELKKYGSWGGLGHGSEDPRDRRIYDLKKFIEWLHCYGTRGNIEDSWNDYKDSKL